MTDAPLSPESQAEFDAVLAGSGLSDPDLVAAMRSVACEGAEVIVDRAQKPPRGVGASRIGGLPDLPAEQLWPQARWGENTLMGFVAQINLADLPPIAGDPLPREGLLSFFADCAGSGWEVDVKVLFFRPGTRLSRRREPPEEVDMAVMVDGGTDPDLRFYRPFGISMRRALSFDTREIGADLTMAIHKALGQDVDRIQAFWSRFDGATGDDTRILGAPIAFGDRPAIECYLEQKGLQILRYKYGISRAEVERFVESARAGGDPAVITFCEAMAAAHASWARHEAAHVAAAQAWRPLFQLGSVFEAGMGWNDAGVLRFMIHDQSLQQGRFAWVKGAIVSS